MSLAPLINAPLVIQVHAFAAMAAFVLGLAQFARPKGTPTHRALGWTWVVLIAVVAVSSFWIHEIRLWGRWSPIHLLTVFTLATLPLAVLAARRHRRRAHAIAMASLFVGGLLIAGLFTLVPGRIMHQVLFGG